MNSVGISEIIRIIKEKYKIDIFNISHYDIVNFCLNVEKFIKGNHNFILISDNKEHLNTISLLNNWDFILFYKDDYITFNKNNYKDIINMWLKRIIERSEEYDNCSVCLENIGKCLIGYRCEKCGVLICDSCFIDVLKKYDKCIICKKDI